MATLPPDPYAPDPELDPEGKPIPDTDQPDALPGPDNTHPDEDEDDAGDAPSDSPTQTQA